ncbi:MAG: CRISPR-associated protein Cas4 [Chloroflexota bacterium]|nr:CRISPR-associated protein Cas4 [Chloroflexota bacterium]
MAWREGELFTVTDLKQYYYCQRILYYHRCLPDVRPTTVKMGVAIRRHEDEPKRAMRRTMHLEGLEQADRYFDVSLVSHALGLSGQVDELIVHEGQLIPVDYKLARREGTHFRVQLVAYALMAEEQYQMTVQKGLIYLIQARKTVEIRITSQLRKKVTDALVEMRRIAETERMPTPPESVKPCLECEFRRFCNDVV